MSNIADDISNAHHEGYETGKFDAWMELTHNGCIDWVPVVCCKDCKYGKTWKNAFGIEGIKCDLLCVDLSPEAFCYYGVRKDGANDEP